MQGWLSRAPETLILIWLSEWIETNTIEEIIEFPFQNYSWVEIEIKTVGISWQLYWAH